MSFRLIRASVLTLLLAVAAASVGVACSRQDEGQRCSLLNGDADCQDGLVCVPASSLRDGGDGVDRCCPDGDASTPECIARIVSGGGPGLGGAGQGGGAQGGAAGSTGTGDGDIDAPCQFTSQCRVGLVCGPTGLCQNECQTSRDCDDGEVCNEDLACVPE